MIGTTELLLIGGMALILFGGKKLPEMMRGLGQGVKEFKKGMSEVSQDMEKPTQEEGSPTEDMGTVEDKNQEAHEQK